jgi:hypothetical protein
MSGERPRGGGEVGRDVAGTAFEPVTETVPVNVLTTAADDGR